MPTRTIEIDGAAALVSNASARKADPRTFSAFRDFITDAAGRIRKRPGIGAAIGSAAPAAVTAMHEYVFTDPTSGAKTYWLIRATDQALQYKNGAAWTTMALPTFTTTGTTTPTAGGLWWFENIDNRCFACNGKDDLLVFDGTSWKLAGCDGPVSAMGYVLGGAYTTGSLSATITNKGITGTVPAIWTGFDGKTIDINGIRYTIGAVTVNGNGTTIPPQANLTETFKEATAAGMTYAIYNGAGSWADIPPRYAYAYYNPTTGHCSNIRAASLANENVTEIVEKNQTARTITLNNIVYSPAAFANGFTRIKIFRTPKNANILVALSTDIANSNAAGSTTFTENATTFLDTYLTKFTAQRTKLRLPPTGLTSIRYHMGRLWGTKGNRLYFAANDAEVPAIELGLPEESWPSDYNRKVNEARGLVVTGAAGLNGNLIVQTAIGDFAVSGYDHRDIAVVKLPTRSSGSFAYGAIGTGGELVALYADKRLMLFPGETDLASSIQDRLDATRASLLSGARVYRFTWQSRDFLFLGAPKTAASTTNDVTYVRDLDQDGWYEWNRGFTAFTTGHDPSTGALQLWASDSTGASYQLLQDATWRDGGADFQPTLTTQVIQPFDEYEGDLERIVVYANDVSGVWTGELRINEQAAGGGAAFTMAASRHESQSAQGRRLEWTPPMTPRTKATTYQISLTLPAQNADLIIEKIILVFNQAEAAG